MIELNFELLKNESISIDSIKKLFYWNKNSSRWYIFAVCCQTWRFREQN